MTESLDVWKFVAGLGIFLFGMNQMETALKSLTGRAFKLFLKRQTTNKYKAILSGTAVTAILQSSSVVSLMTLAFVGAGIISMKNALGIIFGSNLGTTFTGWIVATLGFKLNIEDFALPLIGIGGVALVLFSKWEKIVALGRLFIGFGFLFLGLDFMKLSIEYLAQNFDVSDFSHYSVAAFLLIGFLFTAIIQSSSATIVITLSALSSGIIPFDSAAGMVIGANLGTTITALIGGLPGIPAKKRVALGHFIFNLVTALIAIAAMNLLVSLIHDVLGISDPVIGLALFHSVFNLLGIIIFIPLINYLAIFLDNRFKNAQKYEGKFIHKVTVEIPEAAMEALNNEAQYLLEKVVDLNLLAFSAENSPNIRFWEITVNFKEKYHEIKRLEGEIYNFYRDLQKEKLEEEESVRINQLVLVIQSALHSAKSIKDIEPDLKEFDQSTKALLNTLNHNFKERNEIFIKALKTILKEHHDRTDFEDLAELQLKIQKDYDELIQEVDDDSSYRKKLDLEEVSTIFTINREIYSASKALLQAVNYYLLTPQSSFEFGNLPVSKK